MQKGFNPVAHTFSTALIEKVAAIKGLTKELALTPRVQVPQFIGLPLAPIPGNSAVPCLPP